MRRLRLHFFPLSLIFLSSLTSFADATCYAAIDGKINKQRGWVTCPGTAETNGIEVCCMPGSQCGEDSICHIPASQKPGNNAWYLGGCTDPTYLNPVCRNACEKYQEPFIEWISKKNLWMCCGDDGCNGTNTPSKFEGASPGDWNVITGSSSVAAPTSTQPPAAPTSTSPPTSSNPQTTTSKTPQRPQHSSSPGGSSSSPALANAPSSSASSASLGSGSGKSGSLSAGAKVGIGAAIGATGAIAIIGAMAAFLMIRRNKQPKSIIVEKRIVSQEPLPRESYALSVGRRSEGDTRSHFGEPVPSSPLSESHHPSRYFERPMPPPPVPDIPEAYGDARVTRDYSSARTPRTTREWASPRTTRDYRFTDTSRRDSIRTTRDYRFDDD